MTLNRMVMVFSIVGLLFLLACSPKLEVSEDHRDVSADELTIAIPADWEKGEGPDDVVSLPFEEGASMCAYHDKKSDVVVILLMFDMKQAAEAEGESWEGWEAKLETTDMSKEAFGTLMWAIMAGSLVGDEEPTSTLARQLTIGGNEAWERQWTLSTRGIPSNLCLVYVFSEDGMGMVVMTVKSRVWEEYSETWNTIRDSVELREVSVEPPEAAVEELEAPGVTFTDRNLEAAVRDALGKLVGEKITAADLAGLTKLGADSSSIADVSGLEYCTNLTSLSLHRNQISDISPLANLTSLTGLYLVGNQIGDISPLANLTNLTRLILAENQISDISPLANLTSLTVLRLSDNQIGDISPLANLTSLTSLDLADNQISDIAPLANLTSLTELYLVKNLISDISPLANLTNLTRLTLQDNQISDISPLLENSGLGTRDVIGLKDNNLNLSEGSEDMENIRALQDRGVMVYYE